MKTPFKAPHWFSTFLAVLNSERRYLQRTIRYRVLCGLVFAVGIGGFLLCTIVHGKYSAIEPGLGVLGAQYVLPFVGGWLLLLSMFGSLCLSFDQHSRYKKIRFDEVIHSRPVPNMLLISGVVSATVFVLWIPTLLTIVTCFVIGLVLQWSHLVLYGMLEPWSVIGWLCITFPVAVFFWVAIFVLLSSFLRMSLLVFAIGFLLIGFELVSAAFMSVSYTPFFTTGFNSVFFPSTTLPRLMTSSELLQKVSLLLLAIAAIFWATALHARRDGFSKLKTLLAGTFVVSLASLNSYILVQGETEHQEEVERWRTVHEAIQNKPRGDIERISGEIHIDPGVSLELDLELKVKSPQLDSKRELVFTLNPGFIVDGLKLDGIPSEYVFKDGLLILHVPSSIDLSERFVLTLKAKGRPNPSFAYLDASLNLDSAVGMDDSLAEFGLESSLFDKSYIALMPGVSWMPSAGSYLPPSSGNAKDFYQLDLTVVAPSRLEIVGPGTNTTELTSDGIKRTRFVPVSPVADIALFASEFQRYAMQSSGLTVELLVQPYHQRSLDVFMPSIENLRKELDEFSRLLLEAGMDYDLGTLSFVEVPIHLRTIGGGWSMSSVQALPGIMLLREHQFLKSDFRKFLPEFTIYLERDPMKSFTGVPVFEDPRLMRLASYFLHDMMGGNILAGIARNFTISRVNVSGPGASALEHFVEVLFSDLFFKGIITPYYNPFAYSHPREYDHLLWPPVLLRSLDLGMQYALSPMFPTSFNRQFIQRTIYDEVISETEATTLIQRNLAIDPELSWRLLDTRAYYASQALIDSKNHTYLRRFIGQIIEDYEGRDFDVDDLIEEVSKAGFEDEFLFTQWLVSKDLAGYVVSTPKVTRLPDLEDGTTQYRTSFNVRNQEEGTGIFTVYSMPQFSIPATRIEANSSIEVNAVTTMPSNTVQLHTYFSRNRYPIVFHDTIANIDEEQVDQVLLPNLRKSNWKPQAQEGIIVDDLDPGFSVVEPEKSNMTWIKSLRERRESPRRMDNGIATWHYAPSWVLSFTSRYQDSWSRHENPFAIGNAYRRTIATYMGTAKNVKAEFETSLPTAGIWSLDYHLSQDYTQAMDFWSPEFRFLIETNEGSNILEMNPDSSNHGWLRVGTLDLPQGAVVVELTDSNEDGTKILIADAIRWIKVSDPSN